MPPIIRNKADRERVRTEMMSHANHFTERAQERKSHDLWATRVYAVVGAQLERCVIDLCGPTPKPRKKRSKP